MSNCTDRRAGRLLHDYEMGWLSEQDHEQYELHLMGCEHCFEKVRQYKHVAKLLNEDEEVRHAVADSITIVHAEPTIWKRLVELLWPRTNLFGRPAVAYLMVLALLPLAYLGTIRFGTSEDQVGPLQSVDLVSIRGSLAEVITGQNADLVLNFGFDGAVPGKPYRVTLQSVDGHIIYHNESFLFDSRQAAHLRVPINLLNRGEFLVITEDLEDASIMGRDTLRFMVK